VSKIVGIDLGTTNSMVATVDSGIPLVIADPEGQRLTPSVIHFLRRRSAGRGPRAKSRPMSFSRRHGIFRSKRFMAAAAPTFRGKK